MLYRMSGALKAVMSMYLLQYIRYPSADIEYCSAVCELLSYADDWVLLVEQLYADCEAHAVSGLKGNITHIPMFPGNSDKTVYKEAII